MDPLEAYEYAEKLLILRLAIATVGESLAQDQQVIPDPVIQAGHDIIDHIDPLIEGCRSATGPTEAKAYLTAVSLAVSELEVALGTVARHFFESTETQPDLELLAHEARKLSMAKQYQYLDTMLHRIETVLAAYRGDAEARGSEFRKQLRQQRKQVQSLMDGLNQSDANRVAEIERQVVDAMTRYEACSQQVERLLGEVAVSGIAHGHAASEIRENKSADRWRRVAVGFAVAAVAAVALTTWLLRGLTSTQWITIHLGLILGFGGLAAYAGRQSAEHRREERWARDSGLRLAAVTIWMQDLPDEVRRNLKGELVEPFFLATPFDRNDVNRDASSPVLNTEVMGLIAKLLAPQDRSAQDVPRGDTRRERDGRP